MAFEPQYQGIEAGSFLLYPSVNLTVMSDDNIYGTRTAESRDVVTTLSPSIVARSNWDKHRLVFNAGVSADSYNKYSSEDVVDWWVGADGRYDLSERSNVFGGVRATKEHEDRASAESQIAGGSEPITYTTEHVHVGYAHQFDRLNLRVAAVDEKLDFNNPPGMTAGTSNDDRDRTLQSLGVRAGMPVSDKNEVFVQAVTDERDYDRTLDDNGYQRSSSGHRVSVGVHSHPAANMQAEFFAGQMKQNYDDARLPDVDKPYYGGKFSWMPDMRTRVSASLDRSINETTLSGASSYVDTTVSGRVEREIGPQSVFNTYLSHSESEYQGNPLYNTTTTAGAGLRHYVSSNVYLAADYRFTHRDSNDVNYDYYRNQIMFSIGYGPKRHFAYEEGEEVRPVVELVPGGNWKGLYLGGMLGHGGFGTQTLGERGGSGIDSGPMGALGSTWGVFLGYNFMLSDRWLLAPELEAEDSDAGWYHSKDKGDANTGWVEKHDSIGAALRLGYLTQSGSILYGRAGQVRTNLHTYYGENDVPSGAYHQDNALTGTRYGLGADIPAGNNMFVRMDYTYTDYPSFTADYQTTTTPGAERMTVDETLFRIGLGWKFGGNLPQAKVSAAPVSGFYAGAGLGHGSLDSQLDGIQNDSSGCTNCAFTGAFADMGTSAGMFAGYGWALSRWYVGLEFEADANGPYWQHIRTGNARDFSADKKGDMGLALRLGYTLQNGVLLYGRAGQVIGKFNTTYEKGGSPSTYINQDNKLNGNRIGLGAEVPFGSGFVRMDYSYTQYDNYSFVTTQSNPDSMTYSNSESLFRLGLGYRF